MEVIFLTHMAVGMMVFNRIARMRKEKVVQQYLEEKEKLTKEEKEQLMRMAAYLAKKDELTIEKTEAILRMGGKEYV